MQSPDDLWSQIVHIVAEMHTVKVNSARWDELSHEYNTLCYKYASACGEMIFNTNIHY